MKLRGVPAERILFAILLLTTLIIAFQVYKRWANWFAEPAPPANQAWLTSLRVAYHPQRLEADVLIPEATVVQTDLVSKENEVIKTWEQESLASGNFTLERPLEGVEPGEYAFRVGTESQRTTRAFTLKSS